MTTLNVAARPADEDVSPRPVPWRRMAWVIWRQHRIALVGVVVFLGALAVLMWLAGLRLHRAYAAAIAACHPAATATCGAISTSFTGSFRYAWTQGFGRWRWTLAKLVPLAVAVAAAAGVLSVLFSWYYQPYFQTANQTLGLDDTTPFLPGLFDLDGVAFAAWTLAAFAIGALAGMLIRRVVPAIIATLTAYTALAFAVGGFLRQHYLTPLITSNPDVPGSAWVISQWWTRHGTFAFAGFPPGSLLAQDCPGPPSKLGASVGKPTMADFAHCLAKHGYTRWTSYQPASRFWPFQWIEAGWLLALSALLIAATVWLVRRRAA